MNTNIEMQLKKVLDLISPRERIRNERLKRQTSALVLMILYMKAFAKLPVRSLKMSEVE